MFFFGPFYMGPANKEEVLIITEDYEVKGEVYNIGFSKQNRFLSDLLNKANKNFIAVKNCEVVYKNRGGEVERYEFLQLNMRYVILMRPLKEDEKIDFSQDVTI